MPKPLSGLPYYGGKNVANAHGPGKWIARMLPWAYKQTYIEPFAGMLGVLLQRPKCCIEIVNDLDEDVITWWQVVRDQPKELGHLVDCTPISRKITENAIRDLKERKDELSLLERAHAFTIILWQSIGKDYFGMAYRHTSTRKRVESFRLLALANRIENVQLECRDALDIIDRGRKIPEALFYLDPPYEGTTTRFYNASVDHEELIRLITLPDNEAFFALSGYRSAWERLLPYAHAQNKKWVKHVKKTLTGMNARVVDGSRERTEYLITNFDLPVMGLSLFSEQDA